MIMKKIFTVVICLSFLSISVFAQQGKYVRKSVSSLQSVWIKPGALQNVSNVDMDIFNNFMKFYIEVPRFDFNTLPQNQIDAFLREANAKDSVDVDTLSMVMDNTIVKDILKILNDPDVKMNRGGKLKSEADLQSFAATKAKSLGLTTEELKVLMNSAYIYLPYVTEMSSETKEGMLSVDIKGGIIWWRVGVQPNGDVAVTQVLDATTSGMNSIDLNATELLTDKKRTYDEYSFGDKKFKTTPQTYVQAGAILAFAKNLSVKTKALDDFKLQAQVAEKSAFRYGFKLGLAEGVHMDDGFFLVELTEDEDGNEKSVKLGFLRIAKTGKNNEDPLALSSAKQLYGKRGDVGSLVMEHPRLGMDTRFRMGLKTINNFNAGAISQLDWDGVEEIWDGMLDGGGSLTAFMMEWDIAYNVAPIIGVSQTFLDVGFGLGMITSKQKLTGDKIVAPLLINFGMGVSHKFWFGRMNVPVGAMLNFQGLSLTDKDENGWSFSSFGLSLTTGFEFMLSADIVLHADIDLNMASPIASMTRVVDGEDFLEFDAEDLEGEWGNYLDVNFGGTSFRIGIDYALGELPFDVFGFLDPMKKY